MSIGKIKKKLSRKLTYYFIIQLLTINVLAQDPQFSQFYANPLYLGPSFAGAVEGSRIAGQYRNQWWDMKVPFNTYSFSYDHYFTTFNSGVGILFLNDVAGSGNLGLTQIGLHYSYNFKVFNVWHIRPGLSFSYIQQGLNGTLHYIDEIKYIQQGGPNGGTSAGTALHDAKDIDAGVSALVYTIKFWIGSTVDHLLTPNVSLYAAEAKIPVKVSIYGGYEFRRRGKLLKPSDETMTFTFLYKQQQSVRQLDLGVYWHNYPIILGLWYRGIPVLNSQRGDALIFLAGIKTRSINIGYSYDFTISNMLPATKGSHEISFTYKFLLPERRKKGSVPCPEF
jgi:type IX secretion system PorP/SprF family membrane protein